MGKEGFLKRIYHGISERIVAKVEPETRERVVLKALAARNGGKQPDEETLHHYSHIPRKAIKEILIDTRRKGS